MTTHTSHRPSPRARRRSARIATGLVAAAGALLTTGHTADAARPSTDAEHVAAAAGEASDALARFQRTADPIDFAEYLDHRSAAAEVVAEEFGAHPSEITWAWTKASLDEQHALLAAITQLGTSYRSLGDSPDTGFDCSGLTSWAYSQAGVDIPRTSGGQIGDAGGLDEDELFAGALVHYPGHVGLYVGAGLFVHSPYTGSTVEITTLPDRSLNFGDLT